MTAPEDRKLLIPDRWWDKLPRPIYSTLERVPSSQPWFEVYKVLPGVYAIYEPGQYEEALSTLILGDDTAALIDTGCGIANMRKAVEEITDQPVTVVNTHSHGDHIGGNHQFNEVAAYDSEFSRERAKLGQSMEQMGHYLDGDMVWKPLPPYFDKDSWSIRPFRVTRWLKDGDAVDLGGRELKVIHTPGHSPDSVCILDRASRILWTGDTFYPAPIYVYSPTTSLDMFIDSFSKMVRLLPIIDWVMPSHNEPRMEKHLIRECHDAAVSIRDGAAGPYKEGTANGIKVHRYDYERFSLIVRVERP